MNKMNSIRMTSNQYETLHSYLLADPEQEAAAFLIAGFFKNDKGVHFVVRDILIPEDKDYDFRSSYHLEVSPIFFNKAISRAERNNITVIQCHSHPFSKDELWYSSSDYSGESLSSKTIYDCLAAKPMGSLLFGPDRLIGRAWLSPGNKPVSIDQIRIVDRHMKFQNIGPIYKSKTKIDTSTFDRQIRAFGIKGQELLSQLTIGIIGVGGTGSSIAEQLAREGVKNFIIVDHDKFENSNKTRVYGSYTTDKGKYKIEIAKNNIQKIQSDANVKAISKNVISQEVLRLLKNCDIIFSCTDKHAPRSVVNEIAYQFFIPVIDVGVGLDAKNEKINGGFVRATLVSPTLPCMYCIGFLNSETILSESLSKSDRESRQKEGYIRGLQDDVPSVITFTTMAASFGLLLFKDLLFDLLDTKANTIGLDITSFRTSRLAASVKDDCVCTFRMGKADYIPLSAP